MRPRLLFAPQFECCGAKSPDDWATAKVSPPNNDTTVVPQSCCGPSSGFAPFTCSKASTPPRYTEGCVKKFGEFVRDKAVVIGGAGITIALIQVRRARSKGQGAGPESVFRRSTWNGHGAQAGPIPSTDWAPLGGRPRGAAQPSPAPPHRQRCTRTRPLRAAGRQSRHAALSAGVHSPQAFTSVDTCLSAHLSLMQVRPAPSPSHRGAKGQSEHACLSTRAAMTASFVMPARSRTRTCTLRGCLCLSAGQRPLRAQDRHDAMAMRRCDGRQSLSGVFENLEKRATYLASCLFYFSAPGHPDGLQAGVRDAQSRERTYPHVEACVESMRLFGGLLQ